MAPSVPVLAAALLFAAATLLSAASFAASAQQSPALDRVSLWLGGYYSHDETRLSAEGTGPYAGIQGELGFENDLGFKNHSVEPRALRFPAARQSGIFVRLLSDPPRPRCRLRAGHSIARHRCRRARPSTLDYDFGAASYK